MLRLFSSIKNVPVFELEYGRKVGNVGGIIVNNENFTISLIEVVNNSVYYLLPADITVVDLEKILIRSNTDVSDKDDLVRYKAEISKSYSPIAKIVETASRMRLGRVYDFSFDTNSFVLKKLYIKVPLLKRLLTPKLIIDKKDIVETTKNKIIVKDSLVKVPHSQAAMAAQKAKL